MTRPQQDSSSCRFFAVNAISHAVFNVELLDHNDIRSNRLQWFNKLCVAISNQVSLLNLP